MAKNKKDKVAAAENISRSKAKREERRKQTEKERHQKLVAKITGIAVTVVIVLLIALVVGRQLYKVAMRTTSSSDLSAGLTADGKIDGVDALSLLTLADYENISVPADEVAASEEEVDNAINSLLESHKELSMDPDLAIADGDVVNIDYVGTIDGIEFEGGSSGEAGYDLTIGSGSFIDDFEEQLIGHKPGENVTVDVTFPENYREEEHAGKDASFAVTVNGIMVTPELTDEFVAENLADTEGVSTASEYREKLENEFYEEHLEEYLTDYIVENSTVNSYPKKYVKIMKSINKYNDEYMMEYYNQMYAGYGMTAYENVWETRGTEITDELSYEKELTERAKENVKTILVYEAVFEKAGLTLDMEAYFKEMAEEYGEDYVENLKESYGEGYLAQNEMVQKKKGYLMDLYK